MPTVNIERLRKLDYRCNEAYKTLRTNIQLCGSDMKVIMFTSSTPNEGKSSVSFNLAVSLAESGKKVIFIDADLRKSVLVGRYKINKAIKGLTHFLSGMNKFELLANNSFDALVKALRDTYDYVIIDTPPLGSVTDAAIVAQKCDGAVLVVAAHMVNYKFVQKQLEQLKMTKCKILGSVLNKVDLAGDSYYGKYYGNYYGKYYGNYSHGDKE